MTQIEQLTAWLNNAYAMEQNLAKVLESHARDAKEFPTISERLEQHVEETNAHAERVAECLAMLGEKPSAMKAVFGNVMGRVQGAVTGMFDDELLKNMLADCASEHFEIACYTSLIEAASVAGHSEIAQICANILDEEEAMADWVAAQIPDVTRLVFLQSTAV